MNSIKVTEAFLVIIRGVGLSPGLYVIGNRTLLEISLMLESKLA